MNVGDMKAREGTRRNREGGTGGPGQDLKRGVGKGEQGQ